MSIVYVVVNALFTIGLYPTHSAITLFASSCWKLNGFRIFFPRKQKRKDAKVKIYSWRPKIFVSQNIMFFPIYVFFSSVLWYSLEYKWIFFMTTGTLLLNLKDTPPPSIDWWSSLALKYIFFFHYCGCYLVEYYNCLYCVVE